MNSLRLIFTSALLALPLVACGNDGNSSASNSSQSTDPTTESTDPTDGTATEPPTTGTTADPGTTTNNPDPVTTTDPDPSSTTEPDPSTTTDPDPTTTTDPSTTTDTTTTEGDALSWETDVFPAVIDGNCGCHGNGAGGLTMSGPSDSYSNLVDVDSGQAGGFKRVLPGEPENSYIVAKLKGVHKDGPFNGSGGQMPAGGAPPLSEDQIATLEQWIVEGAAP